MKTLTFKHAVMLLLSVMMVSSMPFGVNAQGTVVKDSDKKVLLIDVRTAEEFKQDGIEKAVNVPYQTLSKEIKSLTHAQKDLPIKLYCRSGRRAGIALKTLEQLGYTNVVNLGGVDNARQYIKAHPIK